MARKSEGLTKDEQIQWRNMNATVYMLRKRMTFINDPLLRKVFDWQLANEKLIEQKKEILGEIK
jgi:hypothetical protein